MWKNRKNSKTGQQQPCQKGVHSQTKSGWKRKCMKEMEEDSLDGAIKKNKPRSTARSANLDMDELFLENCPTKIDNYLKQVVPDEIPSSKTTRSRSVISRVLPSRRCKNYAVSDWTPTPRHLMTRPRKEREPSCDEPKKHKWRKPTRSERSQLMKMMKQAKLDVEQAKRRTPYPIVIRAIEKIDQTTEEWREETSKVAFMVGLGLTPIPVTPIPAELSELQLPCKNQIVSISIEKIQKSEEEQRKKEATKQNEETVITPIEKNDTQQKSEEELILTNEEEEEEEKAAKAERRRARVHRFERIREWRFSEYLQTYRQSLEDEVKNDAIMESQVEPPPPPNPHNYHNLSIVSESSTSSNSGNSNFPAASCIKKPCTTLDSSVITVSIVNSSSGLVVVHGGSRDFPVSDRPSVKTTIEDDDDDIIWLD